MARSCEEERRALAVKFALPAGSHVHGTRRGLLLALIEQGFQLWNESHGRELGNGVYLTQDVAEALDWGDALAVCTVRPGTRLLHVPPRPDSGVLDRLRRRFGRELIDRAPDFSRALPRNKQLTPVELAHLVSLVFWRRYNRDEPCTHTVDELNKLYRVAPLYEWIRRASFGGLTHLSSSSTAPELVVFSPSNVQIDSVRWLKAGKWVVPAESELLAEHDRLIAEEEEWLVEQAHEHRLIQSSEKWRLNFEQWVRGRRRRISALREGRSE